MVVRIEMFMGGVYEHEDEGLGSGEWGGAIMEKLNLRCAFASFVHEL